MVDDIPIPKRRPRRRRTTPPSRYPDEFLRNLVVRTFGDVRWTQDTPVVPDVWFAYMRNAEAIARRRVFDAPLPKELPRDAAGQPHNVVSLLITPWEGVGAGTVAGRIRERLSDARRVPALVAAGSSRVVADLDVSELVTAVVLGSGWWSALATDAAAARGMSVEDVFRGDGGELDPRITAKVREFLRFVVLVGFVTRLETCDTVAEFESIGADGETLLKPRPQPVHVFDPARPTPAEVKAVEDHEHDLFERIRAYRRMSEAYDRATGDAAPDSRPADRTRSPYVWLINPNRIARRTIYESRRTAKVDAARRLFEVTGKGIVFAVVDTGIDAGHRAFVRRTRAGAVVDVEAVSRTARLEASRVVATYDFSQIRQIVGRICVDGSFDLKSLRTDIAHLDDDAYRAVRARLAHRVVEAREIDWELLEPLIRISPAHYVPPVSGHGTHVAGILAADLPEGDDAGIPIVGMCPDLELYDLRVFDVDDGAEEFSVLCALEFVGWLNRQRDRPVIHGVNLSIAMLHDVVSFACGKTPVCDACNRLVGTGTVVVAAAGNTGFDGAATNGSFGNGYRDTSITDPGNAELVITVGATHRRDPHAYGVSFFSSRGPTGDGRAKPDLLAPGEKIYSTLPNDRFDRLDGTSMAAPHVSGAAALLMARYPELVGAPERIKEILMKTATDLGREKYFQGAGMLDVLRALQSV